MKTKRAIGFELNRLTEEQLIILGCLTYHAGKLWNQANYLIQNRLAKPYYKDLYHKLKDKSINLRSLRIERTVFVSSEGTTQCRCKWSKEHLKEVQEGVV